MDLFEYAWLTSFQITKKKHDQVKILLRSDIKYPMLGKDPRGHVIYLPKPKRRPDGLMSYLGLLFDLNNEMHKRTLWQTFKASVFHLSMHIAASNFEAYADWSKGKNIDSAIYIAGMIEDATARAFLRTQWTPFISDVAIADTISYLKMKPVHLMSNHALRLMTSVISQFSMGKIKGRITDEMKNDVNDLVLALNKIEGVMQQEAIKNAKIEQKEQTSHNLSDLALNYKIAQADYMNQILEKYGETSEVPSFLYAENHGMNSIFYGNDVPSENEVKNNLENALSMLRIALKEGEDRNGLEDVALKDEVSQIFSTLEAKEAAQNKILDSYKLLGAGSRFRSFEFPQEDFSEYLHRKSVLASPIRRVLEKLRLYRNQTGEDYRHEVGLLDMQEAIQVIASKSQRTDVFVRDELQTREDAWAILIDTSHSLNFFTGEVRGIALCLSEVARDLFRNQNSWSEFAFSDKFYIVKDFTENYTNRIRARVGGLENGGMSYIPDALLLAAEALKRRTEEVRLLVVVSDFFPSGYIDAEDTLIQSVKKIEKSGMGVIGIGVKSRAVRNYFRLNCVVENPYDLMKKFVKAFFEFSSTA